MACVRRDLNHSTLHSPIKDPRLAPLLKGVAAQAATSQERPTPGTFQPSPPHAALPDRPVHTPYPAPVA
jgi:hypothetical protein